jgi:hypothetical protein
MKTNLPAQPALAEKSACVAPVTRARVRERAVKLAADNGHGAHDVSKSDWEQAKRELQGSPLPDPKETAIESATESERWDPLPGSAGRQSPETPGEGEDDEGRNEAAQLVKRGSDEAERDRGLEADRAAENENRRDS